MSKTPPASVLSVAQLLEQQSPAPPPCLVEPGLLPMQGILFVGGEPNRYVKVDLEMKRQAIAKVKPVRRRSRTPWGKDYTILDWLESL